MKCGDWHVRSVQTLCIKQIYLRLFRCCRKRLKVFSQKLTGQLPDAVRRPRVEWGIIGKSMNMQSEVLAAENQFFAALLAADTAVLRRLLADDFVIVDVLRGGEGTKAD